MAGKFHELLDGIGFLSLNFLIFGANSALVSWILFDSTVQARGLVRNERQQVIIVNLNLEGGCPSLFFFFSLPEVLQLDCYLNISWRALLVVDTEINALDFAQSGDGARRHGLVLRVEGEIKQRRVCSAKSERLILKGNGGVHQKKKKKKKKRGAADSKADAQWDQPHLHKRRSPMSTCITGSRPRQPDSHCRQLLCERAYVGVH